MKLADLIPADYLVIEIAEADLRSYRPDLLEMKGWRSASHAGWSYRVDPPRPEIKQKRHVHIAHSHQTSAKGKQVSWNDDGTRHDKKSFNANMKGLGVARNIAREVLGLPPDLTLEMLTMTEPRRKILRESLDVDELPDSVVVLRARRRSR